MTGPAAAGGGPWGQCPASPATPTGAGVTMALGDPGGAQAALRELGISNSAIADMSSDASRWDDGCAAFPAAVSEPEERAGLWASMEDDEGTDEHWGPGMALSPSQEGMVEPNRSPATPHEDGGLARKRAVVCAHPRRRQRQDDPTSPNKRRCSPGARLGVSTGTGSMMIEEEGC